MAVNQYIGARYVPLITGEWDASKQNGYEPLSVVLYQGTSYTSICSVPTGIPPTDTSFWALTGNYNAQVEQYRQEVVAYADEVEKIKPDVIELKQNVSELQTGLNETNTNLANLENNFNEYATDGKKYIFLGDSYMQGYNPDGNTTDWCALTVEMLGLTASDYFRADRGGIGFVQLSPDPPRLNFQGLLDTLTSTITNKNEIGYIVIMAGYNDNNHPVDDISTAIKSFCAHAKTLYPNATVLLGMVGWTTNSNINAGLIAPLRAYSECSLSGGRYIANSELCLHDYSLLGTDGIHPTQNGQYQIAMATVQGIKNGIATPTWAYLTVNYGPAENVSNDGFKVYEYMNGNSLGIAYTELFVNFKSDINLAGNTWYDVAILLDKTQSYVISGRGVFTSGIAHLIFNTTDGYVDATGGWLITPDNKIQFRHMLTEAGGYKTISNITNVQIYIYPTLLNPILS